MPRGILGSLAIAVVLFVAVSLVMVGAVHYTHLNTSEPVGMVLRMAGHPVIAAVVQAIAVIGMFTALLGMTLAGSRLIYSFGRDGLLPKFLGKLDKHENPTNSLVTLTIVTVVIGAFFPFAFLAQLVSAGTLIAFMFVSLGIYGLRKREGKDIPVPDFKMPFYPVMPALAFVASLVVFWGLGVDAKLYALAWFVLGLLIYLFYGKNHSYLNDK